MRCARCGFDSPIPTRFCGGCGEILSNPCGRCGEFNPLGFRFCGSCGSPVEGAAADAAVPDGGEVANGGGQPPERRQLTVMFCDLVGSTSLSAILDPEELREVVRAYQMAAAEVIERYEGYVAQYLGDGILAYFGYPRALEDEAGRAVRAGRELVAAIRRLNEGVERPAGVALSARVGIHTGVVVVGEVGGGSRRENLALGETPNVAARIQAFADPDQVIVSGETYSLVRADFVFDSLGAHLVRGIAEPVELYRADGEQAMALSRAERRRAVAVPLIGREAELGLLRREWHRAAAGSGRLVLLTGDAGLGKSALARIFASDARAEGALVLSARCLPYFRGSPLHPLSDLLRRWIEAEGEVDAPSPAPRDRLRELLAHFGLSDALPLLASLLGLRHPDREAQTAAAPPRWRERTADALVQLLMRAATERPLLLCLEDVQSADPSTLELVGELLEQLPQRSALILITHRPDFQPPWGMTEHQTQIALRRLEPEESHQLIATLAGGRALPTEIAEQIVQRTDGVPFFVEELTRMVLESGSLREEGDRFVLAAPAGEVPPLAIPFTLHDSLEARLERLSSARELAQLAAVLGREFGYDLVAAVADLDDEPLAAGLERLVEAGLLVRTGSGSSARFSFRHALIQEAAYQSLLKGARQAHHRRVAEVLESRFPDLSGMHPELLAQHFAGAGLAQRAIAEWTRAGQRAVEASAHREAVIHLRQGMDLLDDLPSAVSLPERVEMELEMLLTLGPALIATHGHAAEAVRECYARAHALAEAGTDPERRFEILTGLATACFVRAEMEDARAAAEEMLHLARREGNAGREMAATVALGTALLGSGRIEEALARLEEGVTAYDAERDFPLTHGAGQDFGVVGLVYAAYALLALGRPAMASARAAEALALARSLDHPHTLAFALAFAASLAYLRRAPDAAVEPLAELVALSREEGFRHWLLGAAPLEAWAMVEGGQGFAAVSRLLQGDWLTGSSGRTDIQIVFWRSISAEVLLRAGRAEDAVPILNEVVDLLESRPSRLWWTAEAYRLRARAHASLGDSAAARIDFARSEQEAAAAGARLFLLRALVDRARLFPGLPEGMEAVRQLRRVTPLFTEEPEQPDVAAAGEWISVARDPGPRGAA